jgi:hypothetical protein
LGNGNQANCPGPRRQFINREPAVAEGYGDQKERKGRKGKAWTQPYSAWPRFIDGHEEHEKSQKFQSLKTVPQASCLPRPIFPAVLSRHLVPPKSQMKAEALATADGNSAFIIFRNNQFSPKTPFHRTPAPLIPA